MNEINNFKQEYNKSIETKNIIQKTTDLVSRIIERNKKLNK
jgi:CHASE3 domain sensor protein